MPELPEVETIRSGIAPYLVDQTITQVIIRNPNLRWPIPDDLPRLLPGLTIKAVARRAKFLLLDCDAGTLIIHLGMSGSLRLLNPQPDFPAPLPQKHDHLDVLINKQMILRLRDPRRFGAVLWHRGNIAQHRLFSHLGPEPLTGDFNARWLYDKTRGSRVSIKQILMNNRVVVGVGNIYANEALFHAKINPTIAAGRIGLMRYQALVQAIKSILQQAIETGGSSLRDFVNCEGNPGYFQQHYAVYGRGGDHCRQCKSVIQHIRQNQRSSFYCPRCQH